MDNYRASAQKPEFSRREKQFIRDRDRKALHSARKTGGTSIETRNVPNWAEDTRYDIPNRYDDPPARTASGRGRRAPKRGGAQGGRPNTTPSQPVAGPSSYLSTSETPPSDEPRYNIASLGIMTPEQDKFMFNHTADGFLNVIEQSYNKLVSVDSRIQRRLPFPVYLHNLNQLYYVHMVTIAELSGQQAQWAHKMPSDEFRRLIGADNLEIPEEIWFWLKGLGRMRDKDGIVWYPNFPYVMSPREARIRDNVQLTGGDFGIPDAANHNVYENHIAPVTTRTFVTAMLNDAHHDGVVNYDPLPAGLAPPNGVATANFLGYYTNNRRLHAECLAFYDQFDNYWAEGLGSRIGYNAYLWTKMNAALQSIKDKTRMRTGLPPIDSGSLALYGTIYYDGPSPIIRTSNGRIESASEMDPQSLSIAAISTYRRRRSEDRPGHCYVANNGHALPGWNATRNSEYEMNEPFIPQTGDVNLALNQINFTREVTEGRYNIILDEISRLTIIPR